MKNVEDKTYNNEKYSLNWLNSTVEMTDDGISKLKDRAL